MEVFFYGLFMDAEVLKKNGIAGENPRKGALKGYALKIGNRATLVPDKKEVAYGIVMTVDDSSLDRLYSEASVSDYVPEQVTIALYQSDETLKATCYNLPLAMVRGTNTAYTNALYALAKREGLPKAYLEKIRSQSS